MGTDKNSFSWQVIGHNKIAEALQRSITNQSVSHGYLFVGSKYLGKKTMADAFAQSLLCINSNKAGPVPCNNCAPCQQFKNQIHQDVLKISKDPVKKNIGIDQIRQLIHKLSLGSFFNSWKIGVVVDAEALSLEAANALLKTLEEPKGKTVIILCCSDKQKLPSTILSRCQIYNFQPVATDALKKGLIGKGNKLAIGDAAIMSSGRPGLAINYLDDQEAFNSIKQRSEQFVELMASSTRDRFLYLDAIIKKTGQESVEDLMMTLDLWATMLRDSIFMKLNKSSANSTDHAKVIKRLPTNISLDQFAEKIVNIYKAQGFLRANVNPKLVLEHLMLQL